MKKRLLLGAMLMGAFAMNAQIADGSEAPEITGQQILEINGTDVVYGDNISLQAYLDAGKTVIVDMSAAWCAPCWGFHNSHTLEKLYTAYGPEGSDELRVIFIEADPSTNVLELDGQSLPPLNGMQERGPSQGDWLAGTNYPVINNDTAADAYGLEGFPSVYTIVPSGTQGTLGAVYNLERGSIGDMVAAINASRAEADLPPMVGLDYYGKMDAQDIRYCAADGAITGYVSSTNGHAISSAQVQLKKDGEVLATTDFTDLAIGGYATGAINFTGFDLDPAADYQMELLKVNDNDPLTLETAADFTSAEFKLFPSASTEGQGNITVTITTDEYPAEMGFYIIKYAAPGADAQVAWAKTFPNNNATYKEKTFTYVVPADKIPAGDCYGIVLQDAYGDGWVYNTNGSATPTAPYGITVTDADGTVLFENDGDFGQMVWQDATFTTDGTAANEEFAASTFAVYPNPSTGIFSFSTEETIDVTVVDITGKTVHTAKGIENGGSINLSALQSGMYIAKINGASGERVEKLIIK